MPSRLTGASCLLNWTLPNKWARAVQHNDTPGRHGSWLHMLKHERPAPLCPSLACSGTAWTPPGHPRTPQPPPWHPPVAASPGGGGGWSGAGSGGVGWSPGWLAWGGSPAVPGFSSLRHLAHLLLSLSQGVRGIAQYHGPVWLGTPSRCARQAMASVGAGSGVLARKA